MEDLAGRGGAAGAPDGADLEAMIECVDRFQGAAAKTRLYGPDHPETHNALNDVAMRLEQLLNWLGPVVLSTSVDGFMWRGRPVTPPREGHTSLGAVMHVEGISMIGFAPGLDADELARLLAVLRVNLSLPQFEEETLESLLWQAELKHVSFRAISELMQAEAESGRDDEEKELRRLAKGMVDLQPGDLEAGRELAAAVDPDDYRGGDIVDQWGLDADLDLESVSDAEWGERFAAEAGDDRTSVARLREDVRYERSSQLLSRLVNLVVRGAAARNPELGRETADALAVAASRQIYALGDPVGLLEVVEGVHGLSSELRASQPAVSEWMRDMLRRVYSPPRVARLLRNLDPNEPIERRTIDRFLQILPDGAVTSLFAGVAREEDPASYGPVLRHAVATLQPKLIAWLKEGSRMPTDKVLPLVQGLRVADPPTLRGARRGLARHSASSVREAVLEWYASSLPPEDVGVVAAMLMDRSAAVREAALEALIAQRPPEAVPMLSSALRGEDFPTLEPDAKASLCVAFGKLAGPTGLSLLTELLNTKLGLLRDAEASSTVEAAAMGLAAMGTANAVMQLEKGARGFGGARKQACQIALGVLEQERLAEAGDA